MLSSSEYLDVKPITDFARFTSAHKNAGSPTRRAVSVTCVSDFSTAVSTKSMISRTDAPRLVPMLIAGGSAVVESAAAKCARAISRTST